MLDTFYSFCTSKALLPTIVLLCITSGIGIALGQVKIGKVSLGGAFVFFLGILMAHFGVRVNEEMLLFAQNFGLVLFIYSLGVQVGPGFIATFRSQGVLLNVWSLSVILLGTLLALLLFFLDYDTLANISGLLSGATTNTPSLGAAQQALVSIRGNTAEVIDALKQMALATAITYPLGAVGVFLVLEILKAMFPQKSILSEKNEETHQHYIAEFIVTNPQIAGKSIEEVSKSTDVDHIVSRLFRNQEMSQPSPSTRYEKGDHLLVVCNAEHKETLKQIFGESVDEEQKRTDWFSIPSAEHLVSKRIIVSKSAINGRSLRELRLRNKYGVNITRISRSEIDLVPNPSLVILFGDRLTAVGPEDKVDKLAQALGDQLKPIDTPYLVSIFLGMALGLLLGAVPIALPGCDITVKLGIAGGPIIVGIIMGAYGTRLRMNTHITHSANLMLRTLGITLYLAGLGLSSGSEFFHMIINGPGLSWLCVGFLLTLLPALIIGIIALRYSKQSYGVVGGWICGAMANPMALDFLTATHDDDNATVSYATVYPMGMFIRVIIAQLLITLFI